MVRQNGANTKEQTLQQPDEVTVTVNTKYKDTVFRMLFSDKKNLLSLYNALNGRDYRDPDLLEIVTLDNAIFVARVRKHQKLVSVKAAIEQAVQECIQEGILREFLLKNRAEVNEMSILEYNQKEEEELIRREEKEIGIRIGEERERKNTEKERRRADFAEKENQRLRELLRENGIL